MRRHSASYDILYAIAILASVIALGGGLAHLYELPRKMALSRDAYFTVQQIYSGWDLFAIVLVIQFVSLAWLVWRSAREYYVFRPVMMALLLLVGAQLLFWTFTFPANVATHNWTQIPGNWEGLRHQWEYSHAGGALCQLAGLCCLIGGLFARVRAAGR